MARNWNSVEADHVRRACELLAQDASVQRNRSSKIFLVFDGVELPAKAAMRIAYLLANNLPLDTKIKFTSGKTMVQRLENMGFTVVQKQPKPTNKQDAPNKTKGNT